MEVLSTPTIWSAARRRTDIDRGGRSSDADRRGVRSVFQQDYDRLLFSSPVRRLSDKTQVWPMDASGGVRTPINAPSGRWMAATRTYACGSANLLNGHHVVEHMLSSRRASRL